MLSCAKENMAESDASDVSDLVEICITAGSDDIDQADASGTKAAFGEDYPEIIWTGNESISVLGTATGNQKFTTSSKGRNAEFTGLASLKDSPLYAVYPYDASMRCGQTAEILSVTVPDLQYATAGSFDPKAFVAVGKSYDKDFSLKAIGGMFKFMIEDASNVKAVTIKANDDSNGKPVNIAGTAGVSFDSNGIPTHGVSGTWVGNGQNSIRLEESKGGDQFSDDTFYFITARAHSCPGGLTVYIEYDDGTVYSKSSSNIVFKNGARGRIINLGILRRSDFTKVTVKHPLPDWSYAGYKYSECAPPEGTPSGYRVYDVTAYGAVPNDGKSDREAFLKAIDAAVGSVGYKIDGNGWIVFNHKNAANAVIYFPEGEYILHTSADDVDGKSRSIQIRTSNIIIRGAGRDKTTLVMQDPNLPKNESELYSSPDMIQMKHNSSHASFASKAMISKDAEKGSHILEVSSAESLSEGLWVCLYVKNKDADFVAEQVAPYSAGDTWKIKTDGVEVIDYHRIKSINGNKVTFQEPLMTEVKAEYGWELRTFPHYENIGIEDLTFKGNAKSDFEHHGSWEDDGAYKPISFNRVTDSWIRRVGFESTSEACSIINSACVTAYDIRMTGDRGHSAIRSQASSRVLIAATTDTSSEGKGNFHGVGVSKHSIGTVLWRNRWGDDSCFESHANQPRATLIDCCSGGWHKGHMGGSYYEAPHHLADLVIWNFTATQISESNFLWWDSASWRFLPPVIAGFNGAVTFPENQAKILETDGIESIFEYQLASRLGYIPGWILEIKNYN